MNISDYHNYLDSYHLRSSSSTHLLLVNMVKANLCFAIGSKSFLLSIDVLADERTPTKKSVK